jgi:hypothetical protein
MPVRMKWTLALLVGTCLYVIATADKVGSEPYAFVDERPITVETSQAEVTRSTGRFSTTEEKQALPHEKVPIAKPIAQISGFEGEVIVQSGTEIFRLSQSGLRLDDGDRIQTGQGEVQILFNDGAVMKIRPFTNTMIQEREEKSGFQIFKTKREVRRITCFVGKLWFKSGASKRKIYLQTPNAVCELRGSEGDIGFDNCNTYLNMYTGEADVLGNVIKGSFMDPGIDAATKNRVYHRLTKAYEAAEKAKATEKAVNLVKARVEAFRIIVEAAIAFQGNPDKCIAANPDNNIKNEAQWSASIADANIAAGEANIAVGKLIEAGASDRDIQSARTSANKAQVQAAATKDAADEIYVEGVLDPGRLDEAIKDRERLAKLVQVAAQEATSIWAKVAPPEELESEPPEVDCCGPVPAVIPPEVPLVAPPPYTETTEQEVYQRESSPSQ